MRTGSVLEVILCLGCLVSLGVTPIIGCNANGSNGDDDEDQLPPIEVNLPPVPQLDFDRPVRYPDDDTLSVWGVSLQRDDLFNLQARVRAMVVEIYVCEHRERQNAADELVRMANYLSDEDRMFLEAVVAGTGEGTGEATPLPEERCNYPYLWIADSLESRDRLLVTGYGAELEPFINVGEQYLFEGQFMEETRGFNEAGRGLIYALNIEGESLLAMEGTGLGVDGVAEPEGIELR